MRACNKFIDYIFFIKKKCSYSIAHSIAKLIAINFSEDLIISDYDKIVVGVLRILGEDPVVYLNKQYGRLFLYEDNIMSHL